MNAVVKPNSLSEVSGGSGIDQTEAMMITQTTMKERAKVLDVISGIGGLYREVSTALVFIASRYFFGIAVDTISMSTSFENWEQSEKKR